MDIFLEILFTGLWFGIPILVLLGLLILLRRFINIPDYIVRKVLHIIASAMVIPIILVPTQWWISEIVVAITMTGLTIVLLILERFKFYTKLFIEKKPHEIIFSFIIFFVILASLIAFFWGYRETKYYVMIAIFAWSLGDASASIVGHLLGKHKLNGRYIEGMKSIEGSLACLVFSFTISFVLLMTLMGYVWWLALLAALSTGVTVSLAELFTKKGLDNLTCPLVAGIILFLFSLI